MATNMLSVPICPDCNSFDIRFDAYAVYDPVYEDFDLTTGKDWNIVCQNCNEGSGAYIDQAKWIEISPEEYENSEVN